MELQWHTETDGVGFAALLLQSAAVVCMLRVTSYGQLCSYWFMFPLLADCSGAEYGQLHCRVHAALTAALKRGGLGWAGD